VLVTLADVQPARISWIWPLRLAIGKLHLLWGDPGVGKSTIALDIAARISRGAAWPDGSPASLGAVVILTAEDGLADTVRPRLDAHGGDVTRVHVLRAVREANGVERPVSLTHDLGPLEQAITLTGAVLVVVDPLSAYLGGTDSYRDAEVRTILAPLAAVAERTGAAICGVMHVTKDQQRQALYRGQGSIAFAGAARLVLAVGVDPDDTSRERRFLMPLKSNVGASLLTPAQRVQLGQQRAAVLTLLRICDAGVVARREVFQQQLNATAPPAVPAFVFTAGVPYVPGACFSCGEANGRETYGRCWRCALAWRLVCRLAIPTDVAIVIDGARRDA
jgi:hypothetical protein